jgi:hydrogenase maturation protein HypF
MNSRRVRLPFKVKKPMLACGADLKSAFALAKGGEAILYDGFGDLGDLANLEEYEGEVRRAIKTTGIKPEVVACDMHPGYFSTRFAEGFSEAVKGRLYRVQHHEAHVSSAIIDNKLKKDVIGVAFDGTGYGTDGNIWGGEFFTGRSEGFKRVAHLEYAAMPGADLAVRQPWRMAESYIYAATGKCKEAVIKKMIDRKINSPVTSSVGRLFDAAASIILGKRISGFEAALPIELEKIIAEDCNKAYRFTIKPGVCMTVSWALIIKGLISDIRKKVAKPVMAAKFHNTMAAIISKTASMIREKNNIKKVVLSGGVFQNIYLSDKASDLLNDAGFEVYRSSELSSTDSSLSIGQIAIAEKRQLCA